MGRRSGMLVVLATAVGALVPAVASADTVTSSFEPPVFHTGSVNGQDGWRSAPPGAIPTLPNGYDQEVVSNSGTPAPFGQQSLRMSNAYTNGEYKFQTYSKPTSSLAGESQANTEYVAEFSFISKTPASRQPGLNLGISPDTGEGSRMARVTLVDVAAGIQVTVVDAAGADGEFATHDVAVLDRSVPHTIKFWMKLNPGANNDLLRIAIDGADVGDCFASWENYYRAASPGASPVSINTLQFRSSVSGYSGPAGGGYLFDNVRITTANGAGPPRCGLVIDKKADLRTVSRGDRVGYRVTARNRGALAARNVQLCDQIPRRMTFVSADRRLSRDGSRRCLLIPRLAPGKSAGFHIVLRVSANAPPGLLSNIADLIPGVGPPALERPGAEPPGSPPSEEAADLPGPAAPAGDVLPVLKAKAVVKVR